jgi:Holliday junction resolvase RusA-like endonuclease
MDIYFNIDLSPFSINQAWEGRKFKTPKYKSWRSDFGCLVYPQLQKLKKNKIEFPLKNFIEIDYEFYIYSFKKYDVDNFIKTTSDALTECGIIEDDRFVKRYSIEKFPLSELDKPHIEIMISPWTKDLYKTFDKKSLRKT